MFGERTSPDSAVIRPSAYGLITDAGGRLAIVYAPSGVYLPGGGSVVAEDPEMTVARELREECGLVVQLGRWRRAAIEFVYSATEQTHFEKRSTFCNGHVVGQSDIDAEADHTLEWASVRDATARVTSPSHRWAIEQWVAAIASGALPSIGAQAV